MGSDSKKKKKKPMLVSWPNCKEKSSWSECVSIKKFSVLCAGDKCPNFVENLMCGNGSRRGEIGFTDEEPSASIQISSLSANELLKCR